MKPNTHSVTLVPEKCIGCTDCIKRCPTDAIRVRDGKAHIGDEKCIDCGMCIKVCRNHAKKAITQPLSVINDWKFKVALPAPTIYAQFHNVNDVNMILTGVKKLGFDDVFEVSRAAELVSAATKRYLAEKKPKKPVLSSACPVVIRLICMNFPSLIDNILPIASPMEIAARLAKKYFSELHGLKEEEVGVFFLTPCPGKATNAVYPLGFKKSAVDGVISILDVFLQLRTIMSSMKPEEIEPLSQSSQYGMDWALSGGESSGISKENAIAVDGLENVITMLEEIENGQVGDVDFVELLSCTGGCVGGPLTLVYSYIAKNYLRRVGSRTMGLTYEQKRFINASLPESAFMFEEPLEQTGQIRLDEDMAAALKKMEEMDRIITLLPNIDCGSCGAPTCKSLAEDIVRGNANIEDCIFMLRKKVMELAEMMVDLSAKIPQTFGK